MPPKKKVDGPSKKTEMKKKEKVVEVSKFRLVKVRFNAVMAVTIFDLWCRMANIAPPWCIQCTAVAVKFVRSCHILEFLMIYLNKCELLLSMEWYGFN